MPRKKVEKPEETGKAPIKKVTTKTTKTTKATKATQPTPKPKKAKVEVETEVTPKKKTTKKVAETPKVEKTKTAPTPKPKAKKPELVNLDERVDPVTEKVPVIERAGFAKTKKFKEDKYVRLASNATQDKFNEMGKKINEGLVEWSFYAIDGELGYHYYLVLDNKQKK